MRFRLLAWRAAAAAWAAQIYAMSASPALTSDHTRSWLARWLRDWLAWQPQAETVRALGLALRKTAHFGEYAFLAFLLFQSLGSASRGRRWTGSLALAAAYALSDEWHQAYVPGRGASVADWLVDVAGATLALAALAWHLRRHPAPAALRT